METSTERNVAEGGVAQGHLARSEKPLGALVRDLMAQVSNMIRHELGLARAEMAEKAGQAGSGVAMIATAVALGIAALVILLLSAVLGLNYVMEPWLSALIVGGVAALIAAAIAAKGKSNLRARNLTPDHTLHSVRDDARFVRQQFAKEKLR